ncbi:hypothetical protein [Micromonospora sp. WMMD1155]|uniref:hypothetical protein n=1 Tax=Micromonospora sp. WMMD1155 TaxID=3016094 RepID=UPI00249A395D|nr:hypothetical protein [Micromonospora sp. WMMD1155]WFE53077.1 hypothetical protein O7617_23375 [Micromonospora sp. WMMD1155]
MTRWESPTTRRAARLSRRLCLLVVVLVGLVLAHPSTDISDTAGHAPSVTAGGASAAHDGRDCPAERRGHAEQACPALSSSTAPVTVTVMPSVAPVTFRLTPTPAPRVGTPQVGTYLCPRLAQLALWRT